MTDAAPPRPANPIRAALSAPDPRVLVTLPNGKRVWMMPRRTAQANVAAPVDPTRRTTNQKREDER